MFDWPPGAIKEIRNDLVSLYWSFLAVATLLIIIFEFFKFSEKRLDVVGILRRVVISIILLWSFEDVLGFISMVTDGVVERIGGVRGLMELMKERQDSFQEQASSWFDFRTMFIYGLNILCYMVALLGYYVTDILIHFTYSILYVLSPLLILAFVSESTAFITMNLYKGIFHISLWKILWSLLGVLLLNLANVSEDGNWSGFLMQALFNVCIGLSMLLIPFFTKSLIGDGLVSAASGAAAFATMPVAKVVKDAPMKALKYGAKKFSSARKRWAQKSELAKRKNSRGKQLSLAPQKTAAKRNANKKMSKLGTQGPRTAKRRAKKKKRIRPNQNGRKTTKKRR